MRRTRFFPAVAAGMALASLPAPAQTPLFLDGTAFGGSRVFSEGLNPLGNPARFDQPMPALYATVIDGDQRSRGNDHILKDMGIGGTAAAVTPSHLDRLAEAPWALRTRAFGVAFLSRTGHTSFTHEDTHSFLAHTDGNPAGSTWADVRRSVVDRGTIGIGSLEQGTGLGFSLRLEHWRLGQRLQHLNPAGTQPALSGGPDPMTFDGTSDKALTVALDAGFLYEITREFRVGLMVDRLNQKHLWDVYERPQARIGAQLDLGEAVQVSLETDLNAAERMPFPEKQRTMAASIRFDVWPDLAVIIGAERRKIGDVAVTRGGAMVTFRTASFLVGIGLQIGPDRPLKGVMMAVN